MRLPILPSAKLETYCAFFAERDYGQQWEDGKTHSLPQDYADMHG